MSVLKRLWTKIALFAEIAGRHRRPERRLHILSRKRVDKLEREVEHLETQLHSRPGGGGIQQ